MMISHFKHTLTKTHALKTEYLKSKWGLHKLQEYFAVITKTLLSRSDN